MKPCPFCGSQPAPLSHLKSYEQDVTGRVVCENLDCPIGGLSMTSVEWESRHKDERAYTVTEIESLRKAVENQYLYGRFDPWANVGERESICSISYSEGEKTKVVEQQVRTYMVAGKTAEDLIASERAPKE